MPYLLFMFFVMFVGVYIVTWFLLAALSVKGKLHEKIVWDQQPAVSILVPARNEEKNIARSLESLACLDYPKGKLELIVIDNGSTDRTPALAKQFKKKSFGSLKVKILTVPTPGKGNALNEGIRHATGEIVGVLDADTFVTPDCLGKTVPYFKDAAVGAVTNYVKPVKAKGVLASLQGIEYVVSSFSKKILSTLDSLYIVPGTLSLIRRDVIKKIGFPSDTLTEDMDVALCILKSGYRIENNMDAVAYTTVPTDFTALLKQRVRWYRGFIENVAKHSDMLFNRKYPHLGYFVLPFSSFLAIFVGISLTLVLLSNLFDATVLFIRRFFYVPFADTLDLVAIPLRTFSLAKLFASPYSTITYALILASSLLAVVVAFRLQRIRLRKSILLLPLYFFVYYTMIMIFWALSIAAELLKFRKRW
ncbi:MAG: glycosyltransferase [Candidatus Aenigmatarchaeota archaeon]